MVIPIILKGRRMSHTSGNRKIITIASGQQITNSKHHNTKAINVLITSRLFVSDEGKPLANKENTATVLERA